MKIVVALLASVVVGTAAFAPVSQKQSSSATALSAFENELGAQAPVRAVVDLSQPVVLTYIHTIVILNLLPLCSSILFCSFYTARIL